MSWVYRTSSAAVSGPDVTPAERRECCCECTVVLGAAQMASWSAQGGVRGRGWLVCRQCCPLPMYDVVLHRYDVVLHRYDVVLHRYDVVLMLLGCCAGCTQQGVAPLSLLHRCWSWQLHSNRKGQQQQRRRLYSCMQGPHLQVSVDVRSCQTQMWQSHR